MKSNSSGTYYILSVKDTPVSIAPPSKVVPINPNMVEDWSIPYRILGNKAWMHSAKSCKQWPRAQLLSHLSGQQLAKLRHLLQDSPSTIKNMLRWILICHMITSPDKLHHYVCHLTKQPWCRRSFADGRSSELMCKHCNARSLTAQLNMSGIEGGSLLDAICNVSPSLWQIR